VGAQPASIPEDTGVAVQTLARHSGAAVFGQSAFVVQVVNGTQAPAAGSQTAPVPQPPLQL
jgi:hypothetical protein